MMIGNQLARPMLFKIAAVRYTKEEKRARIRFISNTKGAHKRIWGLKMEQDEKKLKEQQLKDQEEEDQGTGQRRSRGKKEVEQEDVAKKELKIWLSQRTMADPDLDMLFTLNETDFVAWVLDRYKS